MDFTPVLRHWHFLAAAVGETILITVPSVLLGLTLGILIGLGRTYGGRLSGAILGFYVDTMRAMPLLVILVWAYFAAPLLTGVALQPWLAAVLVLGAHLAAYVAETVRAGLLSVRRGQMNAALALGFSPLDAVRRIVLPQALVRMLPPLGSLLVVAIKDSALASVIAVPELLRQSQVLSGITYHSFEVFTVAMGLYFLLCCPVVWLVEALYRRVSILGAA